MKIVVERIRGDATVFFYDREGAIIYSEGFYGKGDGYIRTIPKWVVEQHVNIRSLSTGEFIYHIMRG